MPIDAGFSLIVPVYGNEGSIPDLIEAVSSLHAQIEGFEAIFVVDGSPDLSYALLRESLPLVTFPSSLLALSRNFGAFAAIRAGLQAANGRLVAVMAADLQEPPQLIVDFSKLLASGDFDVVFGLREGRRDPWTSKFASSIFWRVYRALIMPDIPKNGVDIFAMTRDFRSRLLLLAESNSSLLAQLFWLGGRRGYVGYERQLRRHGTSAWTLKKKLRYLSDSVFSFTDLPVRILMAIGSASFVLAIILGAITLGAKLAGSDIVPGYAGTLITILFFGALNSLGLGIVGTYAWRTFENTKARPLAVVLTAEHFPKESL